MSDRLTADAAVALVGRPRSVDTRCAVAEVRVRQLETAQAALLVALEALEQEMRTNCAGPMSEWKSPMYWADRLAAVLATHRGPR